MVLRDVLPLRLVLAVGLLIALLAPGNAPARADLPPDGTPIARVTVTGTERLAPNDILRRMRLRPGTPFSAADLRADLQSISEIGTINPLNLEITTQPAEGGAIVLNVAIEERPELRSIEFVGNVRFSRNTLLAQLALEEGQLAPIDIRSAAERAIRRFYRDAGYTGVRIAATTTDNPDGSLGLIVTIDEGERITVRTVDIRGNDHFSDFYFSLRLTNARGVLFFKNYFDESSLEDDLALIRSAYQGAGFLDVQVRLDGLDYDEDRQSVAIRIDVTEGPRYRVGNLHAEGVTLYTRSELDNAVAHLRDRRFSGRRLARALDNLRTLYGNDGYIDTEIDYRLEKDPAAGRVDIHFEVTERPVVYVGLVRVDTGAIPLDDERGAFSNFLDTVAPPTKPEAVRREVRLRSGEKYTTADEVRTIERLRNLGIFRDVRVLRQPTAQPDVRDALIVVEEDPAAAFIGLSAGIGELSGPSVGIRFEQPNLGGRADRLSAVATLGTRNRAFRLTHFDRYLGETNTSLATSLYYERDRFEVYRQTTLGASTEFGRPLTDDEDGLQGYLRLRLENVRFNDIDDDPEPAEDFGTYYVAAIRPSLVMDRRDNIFMPTRGWLASGGIETGAADGFLFKVLASYEWYTQPLDRSPLVYGFQQSIGLMPYDADQIGLGERFFLGGSSNLRGFRARGVGPRDSQNDDLAIGGSTRLTQRHELRYPFNEVLAARLFTDLGILETGFLELDAPRIGSGVGLLLTMGPVLVEADFAIPVLKQSDDETQFFHLRIGSRF